MTVQRVARLGRNAGQSDHSLVNSVISHEVERWSQSKHDYCLLDEQGRVIQSGTIAHSADGLESLDQVRRRVVNSPAECWVGLETAHNLVIDRLWTCCYSEVYVIAPGSVSHARGRYRQTNAHNDQSDAYVIADTPTASERISHGWCHGAQTVN